MRERAARLALDATHDGATAGVNQQQLLAGHHPQLTQVVQRHVEHGFAQDKQRRGVAPAFFAVAKHLVAQCAGAEQNALVGHLHHGQGTNVRVAGAKAFCKAAHRERSHHRLQVGGLRCCHVAWQLQGRLGEDGTAGVAAVRRG